MELLLIQNGKTYRIKSGKFKDEEYWVEGLWHEISGKSWMNSDGNPACMEYAIRSAMDGENHLDNNVYYGKIGGLGKLMHASQIGEEIKK